MREAIKECMQEWTGDAERAQAPFTFPASFVGFQGHFPEQPVLPGVCLVLAVLVLAEEMRGARVLLESMASAKFFSVVQPDVSILVSCSIAGGTMKAMISAGEEKVAQLKLKVICA